MRLRYNINSQGYITEIGYLKHYSIELTDEPFSMHDFQAWQKDLNTGEWKYNPIIMVPQSISKLQAVSHLLATERYNDLMTALDADKTGVKRILFNAAHQLDRDSTMVNEMVLALGFSDEDTDTFFNEANKILI